MFELFMALVLFYLIVATAVYFSYEMHEEIFFEPVENKVKRSLLWFIKF